MSDRILIINSGGGSGAGTSTANTFTALNTFSLIPNVNWTALTAGATQAAVINTQYYVTAFTTNTIISGYTGTPTNGTKVAYLLIGCDGSATFTFPAAQRSGEATGTSTVITPSTGTHQIIFTYVDGNWYYIDDIASIQRSITFVMTNGGSALTTGVFSTIGKTIFGGTLTRWTMTVSAADTITVDILRSAAGGAAPSTSIVGAGTKPAIASGVDIDSTTFTGWTSTTVAAGDLFKIQITAVGGTCTSVTLTLFFT